MLGWFGLLFLFVMCAALALRRPGHAAFPSVVFYALAIIFTNPTAGLAQEGLPAASYPEDPVGVSNILVARDTDGVTWATCLSFTNHTKRMIQAVKFGFSFDDAFDTTVGSYTGDRVGGFSPGVLVEGPANLDISGFGNVIQKSQNCWVYSQHIASLSSVKVVVLKVRYGDGSIWVNPNPKVVFTGTYMSNLGDEPHPKYIYCGIYALKYDYAASHPDLGCWKKYQADHAAWKAAHSSPSPSPSP